MLYLICGQDSLPDKSENCQVLKELRRVLYLWFHNVLIVRALNEALIGDE